jgi:hypothetical protein
MKLQCSESGAIDKLYRCILHIISCPDTPTLLIRKKPESGDRFMAVRDIRKYLARPDMLTGCPRRTRMDGQGRSIYPCYR